MKASVIQQICKQYGEAKQTGTKLEMAGYEAQLFVSLGSDALSVAKIHLLETHEEYLSAQTQKGERFFFGYEDVTGLKLEKIDEKKSERSAGFGSR